MAVSKLTMYIQVATGDAEDNPAAIRLGGWSESWYDDFAISPEVKNSFRTLCTKRAALLPDTGVIVAQRYQTIDPPSPAAIELQRFPGASGPCDYPSLSLLCRVAGTGVTTTRPMYLRGIPDAFIVKGEYRPSQAYTNKLNAFITELRDWNFRAQVQSTQVPIIGIEADGTVTLEADLVGSAARSKVNVVRTQVIATKRLVGGKFFIATWTNAFTFKLRNWTAGETQGGSIRLVSYTYPAIPANGVTTGRIVTKKVGRPFEVFRGRKSKKAPT